jgi:hypothetical protein
MTGREGGGQASQRMTRADGKEKVYFVVTDSACTDVPSRTPARTGRTRSIMQNPYLIKQGTPVTAFLLATVPARNRPVFDAPPALAEGAKERGSNRMHGIDKLRRRPSNPQPSTANPRHEVVSLHTPPPKGPTGLETSLAQ